MYNLLESFELAREDEPARIPTFSRLTRRKACLKIPAADILAFKWVRGIKA